jgi:hypothetical protein
MEASTIQLLTALLISGTLISFILIYVNLTTKK